VVTGSPPNVIEDTPLVHACAGPVCVEAAGTAQTSKPTTANNASCNVNFTRAAPLLTPPLDCPTRK
jgi:hypothetical protein